MPAVPENQGQQELNDDPPFPYPVRPHIDFCPISENLSGWHGKLSFNQAFLSRIAIDNCPAANIIAHDPAFGTLPHQFA